MKILNELVQIILRQILALGFLLVAPLIYLIPFIFVVLSPNSDIVDMLAVGMMVTGPFVSGFWTMMVLMFRRYRRMTADGSPYQCSLEGTLAATGWMLLGFFGTLAAELLFCFTVRWLVGAPDGVNRWGWALWFFTAPFVIFSPLLVVWVWGKKNSPDDDTQEKFYVRYPDGGLSRPFSYDDACAHRGLTGGRVFSGKNLSSDQTKSAETIAIENNFSEAKAIAQRMGPGESVSEALTPDQWNAAAFMDTLNDRDQMQEWIDGEPGTMGEYVAKKYLQYVRETGFVPPYRLSRPNPAQAPQTPMVPMSNESGRS
jgi:hypothetical protein